MSLRTFIEKERKYLHQLSSDQRRLLTGYFLYGLAHPMIITFMNTYLWRASGDPVDLALYNMCWYAGLPFGFLLNGRLLKIFPTQKLFLLGCAFLGLGPLLLVAIGQSAAQYSWAFGLIVGISGGFFWGNRNYLTSRNTTSENRFSFISLESTLGAVSSIIAPLIIGWFLVLGDRFNWYSIAHAYEIMSVLGWCLIIFVGYLISQVKVKPIKLNHLTVQNPSALWNRLRRLEMLSGFIDGLSAIFPALIVLTFIGQEESVGTIQSISAGIAAVLMYNLGKRVKHKDHPRVFAVWVTITSLAIIIFTTLFSPTGALIYFVLAALVACFRWPSISALMFEIVEMQEKANEKNHRYALIMDRETFLNVGRTGSLCLFILLYGLNPEITLRYGFLLSIIFQIACLITMTDLTRRVTHAKELEATSVTILN